MMYALNDPRTSLVFIDCFIVLKWMLKCVLLLRIKIDIYIYIYIYIKIAIICAWCFHSVLSHSATWIECDEDIVKHIGQCTSDIHLFKT